LNWRSGCYLFCWNGAGERAQAETAAGAMSNSAAGKGSMRLRPGKNRLPSGNVLSRLRKYVRAIAGKTSPDSMQNSLIQLCSNILK
jgi:hypothetical protein